MALFQAKAAVFRLRRSLAEAGRTPPRLARATEPGAFSALAAQSRTPLWSDEALAERALQFGKVHNLRRAAASLDGLLLPAGAVFSFWRQVGRATRRRGYVAGRMLREGCMVPATGGGLCQLTNALYDVALQSGAQILERHAHSRLVPGSAAASGRDATIAWNYVDLRFASLRDLLLTVKLDQETLTVALHGRSNDHAARPSPAPSGPSLASAPAMSCGVCGETDCFMHESAGAPSSVRFGRTAFVVDEDWPEFRAYVATARHEDDVIALPLDGARLGLARYRWDTHGFSQVIQAPVATAERALAWRGTPPQGPARRAAEARTSAGIARALAGKLGADVVDLTVAQSLLAFLWREGQLGGRRFSVLMTRLPTAALQQRLDAAFADHPERRSLRDYRAPAWIVEAETEALAQADQIITAHAEIAAVFPRRALKLDWLPPSLSIRPAPSHGVIAFPGPTVARKGAFEVREAARRLDFVIRPLGPELEGAGFWDGVRTEPTLTGGLWLDGVAAVVQPALTQEAPRRLLEALAQQIPVIATSACGLDPQPGLTLIEAGDAEGLAEALSHQARHPTTIA